MGSLETLIAEWIKGEIKLEHALKEFERRYITIALKATQGNRSVAARRLGIHRNTLINKVKNLNLS
ncbi:MAG: helix-turn-helix domain-containing protein [Candidatus Polarisedimenticolia bacterium]